MIHGATSGGIRTPEFISWLSMRQRCNDKNHSNWPRYGGRGIGVCDRWVNSFEKFLEDMGPRPASGYSIDRIDPDGWYTPKNCRWASFADQQNNKLGNLTIKIAQDVFTATQLAIKIGVPARTVTNRIHKFNEGLLTLSQVLAPGNRRIKELPTGETVSQASCRLGITPSAVAYRMKRVLSGHMSIDSALGILR